MLQLYRQEYPSRARDESYPRGTSRQHNTHSTESREVRYPWHPWHNRVVTTHRSFTRNGRALFCCSVEESLEARLLEIPQWMFDPAICCRMQLAAMPTVSREALLDLKAVLQCALLPDREVVLQAQHPCWLSLGGADAKLTEPTEGRPTQTISSMPPEPCLSPKLHTAEISLRSIAFISVTQTTESRELNYSADPRDLPTRWALLRDCGSSKLTPLAA